MDTEKTIRYLHDNHPREYAFLKEIAPDASRICQLEKPIDIDGSNVGLVSQLTLSDRTWYRACITDEWCDVDDLPQRDEILLSLRKTFMNLIKPPTGPPKLPPNRFRKDGGADGGGTEDILSWYKAYHRILAIFPKATIEKDNNGQIIIYTNMKVEASCKSTNVPSWKVDDGTT